MKYLNHIKTPKTVVFMLASGSPITINSSDERFAEVCKLLEGHNGQAALDLVTKELTTTKGKISKAKKKGLVVRDGVVWYDDIQVPSILSNRLIQLIDAKIDTESFKKFIVNLMKNPLKQSRSSLYDFLEKNHVPLTEDGHFVAYKSVDSKFKDCYSGKFDNSVGKVVSMPREEVDSNINNTCSNGLHVAAWDYAHNQYRGNKTIEVKVNPKDVVAVPRDYKSQKMRVCRYKVIGIAKKPYGDRTAVAKTKEVRIRRRGGKVARTSRARRVAKIEVASRGGKSGIIRIPSHLKTIYSNGRNQAVIPVETLERFGIGPKSKVYYTISNGTLELSTERRGSNGSLTVGNESLLVKSDVIRDALGKISKTYTIGASKGNLIIK